MTRRRGARRATVRLPGVGDRLDLTDEAGAPLHIVRLRSGAVAIHSGSGPPLGLDAHAAAAAGAFISGHPVVDPVLAERISDVLGGLRFDWVRLEPGDHAVGRTIDDLQVRRRTGVTIVAVLRGPVPLVTPDPGLRLEARDELVVACSETDLDAFEAYMTGGS